MVNAHECPNPEDIMTWLDQETICSSISEHLETCSRCQLLYSKLQKENNLLKNVFEGLPNMPDISLKVMCRIRKASHKLNPLEKAGAYIFIISTSAILFLIYNCLLLPFFAASGLWSVTIVKTLSLLISSLKYFGYITLSLLNMILSGKPILPAAVLVILAILINLLNKRRLSNV